MIIAIEIVREILSEKIRLHFSLSHPPDGETSSGFEGVNIFLEIFTFLQPFFWKLFPNTFQPSLVDAVSIINSTMHIATHIHNQC